MVLSGSKLNVYMLQIISFLLVYIGEFVTSPKALLFYDQIEYLNIVSSHSFWQVISQGHFPIHPIFLAMFWITSRITIPNYTAFLFSILSGVMIYKISKILFKNEKYFWLPSLIFLLFPGVWLVDTNLMIQSLMLPFYLLSFYFFLTKRYVPFIISNFIMMCLHVDGVYWIPTLYLAPFIFKNEIKITRQVFLRLVKSGIISIAVSLVFYIFIYVFIRKEFGGATEQIFTYSSFGLLRIIRNIWVCFINNFGTITVALLVIIVIGKIKTFKEKIAWLLFFALMSIGGAYWAGDLMMRRIVFAGVFISLAIYKYLGKKSIIFFLLLLPITALNAALYSKNKTPVLTLMQREIDSLPKDQVLVSSHYYYPFIKYDGKILWFETGEINNVENYLNNGKRVFMTKESITAPYLLVVGNNYHITSLNKVGNSESRILFEKYKIDPIGDSFEIKVPVAKEISKEAGEPVVFYGKNFWQRLSRMRVNYGDVGIWIWSLISGHKDAYGFTYKDASGAWVSPQIGI